MPNICACGCGEAFEPTKYYGKNREKYGEFPLYKAGHSNRVPENKSLLTGRPDVITQWLEENQGRHLCACGCGQAIKLQREYHNKGIPQWAQGHSPNTRSSNKDSAIVSRRKYWKHEKEWLMAVYRSRCGMCRVRLVGEYEIDHIVPMAKGGLSTLDNAQPLCLDCHKAKTREDTRVRNLHVNGAGVRPIIRRD